MSNFQKRAISSFFFVIILASAIILPSWVTFVVFGIISLIGLWEFNTQLNRKEKNISMLPNILGGALIYIVIGGIDTFSLDNKWIFLLLVPGLALIISELYKQSSTPFIHIGTGLIGYIYVIIPFSLLNLLKDNSSYYELLSFFIMLWVNDSGAYLVGSKFGKKTLFKRISPKKSWEGFWGGVIFAAIAGAIMAHYWSPNQDYINWVISGVIIGTFGTLGDLSASMLKRSSGIKDFSNLIPGHGGILDRFDGILIACPALLVYKHLFLI